MTRPNYAFEIGTLPDGSLSIDVVKAWEDEQSTYEQRLTVAQYGMALEADRDLTELETVRHEQGLPAALQLAEQMAVASGQRLDYSEDLRLFSAGPPDAFTQVSELETQEIPRLATGADWFAERLAALDITPLQPIDDTVNYAVIVEDADPWTVQVAVEKYWQRPDGRLGLHSVPVQSFSNEDETGRAQAEQLQQELLRLYESTGLETLMNTAAAQAVANREIPAGTIRDGLFRIGPPERFTLDPAVEPDSWESLLARPQPEASQPEPHYWTLDPISAETPDGVALGTVLVLTEYPLLPPDFSGDVPPETLTRSLEIAHFADEAAAQKFAADFRSYLVPGLLDGPELAPEVAKLEDLSGNWTTLEPGQPLIRDPEAWNPHRPAAEREAEQRYDPSPFDFDF